MRRHDKVALIALGIGVVLIASWYVWMGLPRWSGPAVGVQPVEGRDDCWRISSIDQRALRKEDSTILEQVPTYWSEVIVVDYPENRIVDHKMTGELTVGDVVCTVRGSQAWYYAPTGGIMRYDCTKVDWPDCPKTSDLPGPPKE